MFSDPEAYERFMGRWSRLVAPLLVDFADAPGTGRLLDVGSGVGSLALAIAARHTQAHVLGIDPSAAYVEYANSTNPFPDRVVFEKGEAQHLDYSDSTFQCSLSLLVFNFLPDREKALAELCRVTEPGGCVAAAVWDYSAGMEMLRAFWDAARKVDPSAEQRDESRLPLCRAGELGELWRRVGLESIREEPLDIIMQFASFAGYWDPFLLGQGPAGALVSSMDGDGVVKLRNEVRRRLFLTRDDVPFSLPARAWAVRGTVPA